MLSEAIFFVSFLMILPVVFMSPFAGAAAYEWLQYMPPYAVYNVSSVGSLSLIMGGAALILWALKDKKEKPAAVGLIMIFFTYILWVNITEVTSIVPGDAGYTLWSRAVKVLIFTFFLCFMAQTRARIEVFLWVVILAIGNFVLSGAVKTVLSGGGGLTVVGGDYSIIGERVYFATVVSALIPLVRYFRENSLLVSPSRKLRLFVDLMTFSCLFAVVGSRARTGLVSLSVLGVFYFFKSKRKMMYLLALPFVLGAVLYVAPEEWFGRMSTVTSYQTDASALGRIAAWKWGLQFTMEHPIVGGGYHSFLMHHVGGDPNHPMFLEAHNMLVETMADHGFVGLGLLLMLYLGCYMNCGAIRRRAKKIPELSWAVDLAGMMQLSLATFFVGSMFISDATLSMPYEIVALSIGARGIVERRLAADRKTIVFQEPTKWESALDGPKKPVVALGGGRPAVAAARSKAP